MVPNQPDLVWDLVDAVRDHLHRAAINEVAMSMANDDYVAAIETLLTAASSGAMVLPDALSRRLSEWYAYYRDHPSATLLDESIRMTKRGAGNYGALD